MGDHLHLDPPEADQRGTDKFEQDFWATNDIDAFHGQRGSERADCGGHVRGAGRMAPIDQGRSIAPEPANASPAE